MTELVESTDQEEMIGSMTTDIVDQKQLAEQLLAVGKINLPNVIHTPIAAGLALVGDAALATDPLWGVGCGWALQSGEWLADSVAPALLGHEPLQRGLRRYRRCHSRALYGHAAMIYDYTTGRKFKAVERLLFSCVARDERLTLTFTAMATRNLAPTRALAASLPRVAMVSAHESIARRVGGRSRRTRSP